MPSQSADFLRVDIPRARAELAPGQVLVVSITGTPSADHSIADDFVKAAELAVECGAPIIEANFSCPNVGAKEGTLYLAPDDAASVAKRIRSVIGHTPLIIKVGVFTDPSVLRQLLDALSHAGTNAVSGINTISMTVNDDTGQPALGTNRPTSGVCGTPIRAASLQFVTAAREAIDRGGLPLTLIGVGGITTPQHIDQVLAAGADFAQTATGMMWNPYLAQQYHSAHTAGA